ncbi:hypothetical protein ACN2CC_25035 [Mesorhizobium muleiense]|uniref:hypothetical protein n=1 Tax=Mesorhizobium muleiense TaxID=1004279 RepID=UPI003AFA2B23
MRSAGPEPPDGNGSERLANEGPKRRLSIASTLSRPRAIGAGVGARPLETT